VFTDIKADLFLILLSLMNATKSSRTHRKRQVIFDVQSFGDLSSPPTMDGDLPEAQVAVSCEFKHFLSAESRENRTLSTATGDELG
jgi:hypothetical protein